MDSYFDRAEKVRRRWDVLAHPFYQRWTCGELKRTDLAFYAGQYRHAVVALAAATARAGHAGHTEEEHSHIELWDGFLRSVDGDPAATPISQTAACVTAWADPQRDRAATLAALYAIESAQPAISETKRAGLIEWYGAQCDSDATRYFDVHAVLDHDHSAHDRRELAAVMAPADESRLLAETERVLQANWGLLDGVQERIIAAA